MPIFITIFVIAILSVTHYISYQTGRGSEIEIRKAKLKEEIMLELKNDKIANIKRKNTK